MFVGQEFEVHTLEFFWELDYGTWRHMAVANATWLLSPPPSDPGIRVPSPSSLHPGSWALGWHTWIWVVAAPARGIADAPQLGLLGGQVQDAHSVCYLCRLFQAEQHEVVAVVFSWVSGVVLQEAHVELRVWEALTDLDILPFVFNVFHIVDPQPELVISGERGGDEGNEERGGGKGDGAEQHPSPQKAEEKEGENLRERGRFRIVETERQRQKNRPCERLTERLRERQ